MPENNQRETLAMSIGFNPQIYGSGFRVMEIGENLSLTGKLPRLAGRLGDDLFDSATPLQPEILGDIKLSHASLAQRTDDLVTFA